MDSQIPRIVTRVSQTKKGRMALFFDGEFDFSVDMETFAKQGIQVGKRYTEEEYECLKEECQYRDTMTKALSMLSYKSYTRKLLGDRLVQECGEDAVEPVLDRLEELGLLNDLEYALRCARDLVRLKRYSLSRVEQELRRRGIGSDEIEEAVSQFEEDDQEARLAGLLLKKYPGALTGEEKAKRRAVNGLIRLGYGYSQIKLVLDHLTEDPDYYEEETEE